MLDQGSLDLGALDMGPPAPQPPTVEELDAARWEEMPTAPSINGKQDDVYFIDPMRGWSVNGLGRIYKTEDGGDSWILVYEQPGTYFRSILFVDELRGFAGNLGPGLSPSITDTTPLYRTVDGGLTWTAVTEIDGRMPAGICNMTRHGNVLLAAGRVAGPSYLMRSNDLGETWTSYELTSRIAMLIDAALFSEAEGIIVGGTSTKPSPEPDRDPQDRGPRRDLDRGVHLLHHPGAGVEDRLSHARGRLCERAELRTAQRPAQDRGSGAHLDRASVHRWTVQRQGGGLCDRAGGLGRGGGARNTGLQDPGRRAHLGCGQQPGAAGQPVPLFATGTGWALRSASGFSG